MSLQKCLVLLVLIFHILVLSKGNECDYSIKFCRSELVNDINFLQENKKILMEKKLKIEKEFEQKKNVLDLINKNKDILNEIKKNENIKSDLLNFIKNNDETIITMKKREKYFSQMFYILKKMILSLNNLFSYEVNDILVLISIVDKNILNKIHFEKSKETLLHYAVNTNQKIVVDVLIDNMNMEILLETEPNKLFEIMINNDMEDQLKKILKIINNPEFIFNNFNDSNKNNQKNLINIIGFIKPHFELSIDIIKFIINKGFDLVIDFIFKKFIFSKTIIKHLFDFALLSNNNIIIEIIKKHL